ncbi:hypothetical protein ES332_D02G132600v1 [Gossypium tomentosum]|uniref:Uncharacterized protein n=1 Tax=Gossypium tomentosum TaxID=34277 RepID=A0A5D2LWL4_GOSTO|nr:hypothetical protein ES332_D02G132600v1 [Gossypium tomentosum]
MSEKLNLSDPKTILSAPPQRNGSPPIHSTPIRMEEGFGYTPTLGTNASWCAGAQGTWRVRRQWRGMYGGVDVARTEASVAVCGGHYCGSWDLRNPRVSVWGFWLGVFGFDFSWVVFSLGQGLGKVGLNFSGLITCIGLFLLDF